MATSEEKIYSGEDYNTEFDVHGYIKQVYGSLDGYEGLWRMILKIMTDYFKNETFTGPRLLDFGCGPTVHLMAEACSRFDDITAAEFAEPNRREVEQWVRNEPGAWDWSEYITYICELEGKSETCEERTKRLRKAIKEVIPCNVLKSNPLEPNVLEPFDAVITSLCIEAACMDLEEYKMAIKKMASLLKCGGTLIMFVILGQSFYDIGGKYFYSLKLNRPFIEETVAEAGFTDINGIQDLPIQDKVVDGRTLSDYEGWLFLTAKKK
ncbi:nicotinamide N-methyltransferase-like [Glandiceps talaboti]